MTTLTRRQQQVFDFLVSFQQEHGYAPTLQEIAAYLGVSGNLGVLRHLKALEQAGLITRQAGSSRSIALTQRDTNQGLPLLGTVQAGQPQLALEEVEDYLQVDPRLVRSPDSFLLRVRGDSMIEAHILEGDLVVVRPQTTAENGEIVVALIDGEATLKRFYHQGDHIRLQPENSRMAPIVIAAADAAVTIIGRVTGLCRVVESS
ncbi:MAG: transcriptional repressor LexA [Desulfuromonadales bacterium]|nr:transcriptional repressor LexA [Desulfuromonadales bacterium]